MKNVILFIAIAIVSINFGSCGNATTQAKENNPIEVIESVPTIHILYFHCERRCPTCIKVGEVSQNLYTTKFADNKNVSYKDINVDKEENKSLAEKYQVTGSALIIDVNGEVKNITVDAFKYARTDPAKLETIIAELIEKGLKNS